MLEHTVSTYVKKNIRHKICSPTTSDSTKLKTETNLKCTNNTENKPQKK